LEHQPSPRGWAEFSPRGWAESSPVAYSAQFVFFFGPGLAQFQKIFKKMFSEKFVISSCILLWNFV
jgi:hypothetical protein